MPSGKKVLKSQVACYVLKIYFVAERGEGFKINEKQELLPTVITEIMQNMEKKIASSSDDLAKENNHSLLSFYHVLMMANLGYCESRTPVVFENI